MESGSENVSPKEAAAYLGVSLRLVYDLAAPHGPIPCYRHGRRIAFNSDDLISYKSSCRSTEIKRAVVSSLNSTVSLAASESALESCFQKLGVKPRLTPTIGRNQPASTPSPRASNVLNIR